jgi:two-component system nitrogen regulation sensor histidine kinase NtrY
MRLRTKLTLTIAAASVVPVVTAALVGREAVERRSRADFGTQLAKSAEEVEAQYDGLQKDLRRRVQQLATDPDDDQFLGPILIGQAQGRQDDVTYRRLLDTTPQVMKERGLNVLTVISPRGNILASGHFPGRQGERNKGLLRWWRGRGPTEVALRKERVLLGRKPETRLTLQTRRVARSTDLGSKVHVVVIGGLTVGPALLGRLRQRLGQETKIRIQDAKGRRLAGASSWSRYKRFPSTTVSLSGAGGREVVKVTLAVSDDALRHRLMEINVAAGALVAFGLVLSLVLGLVVGRRISHPLQEMAAGAEAVAQGDLEQRLPVRSRDELGELVSAFNEMTANLKHSKEQLVAAERVAAWREIARRIAHEIKNPLFPIQTSIETLRKVHQKQHPDFEEIFDESTSTILEEVQRLKTIATEFSQFARMPKPQLDPCPLQEVLASVRTLYQTEVIPVELDLPADLPAVTGDREQLIQVFSNLVKNAREALGGVASPRITLHARALDEQWVEAGVSDNGPGFSEEVLAKIFTPYFTTKGAAGGSGLGLAIVHRIIMDHSGRIAARSDGGEGASFLVLLPRATT